MNGDGFMDVVGLKELGIYIGFGTNTCSDNTSRDPTKGC